jgi:hypothetical protein
MMNGNYATFEKRLTKLENSRLGLLPAHLAGFRIPKIIVHEGDDVDNIIKNMEARGEIPPGADFPAGYIRVIVHRIVDPPKHNNRDKPISAAPRLEPSERRG